MRRFAPLLVADIERFFELRGLPHTKLTTTQILRTCFSPRMMPVVFYRISHALHSNKFFLLAKLFSLVNFTIFGIEIPPQTIIGPGLFLPHTQGTILGARKIGENATIFQQVTLGAKQLDLGFNNFLRPELGDNVTVGAGAKVLGGIQIGDSVIIGANSVVLKDVPAGKTCVGIPSELLG